MFVPLDTGMNRPTLPSRYTQYHFNETMSPLYLVKLKKQHKNNQSLTVVRSVEPVVPNFRRKSFNVRFFQVLSLVVRTVFWQKIFYLLIGLYQKLLRSYIYQILTYKLELNFCELRCVTVMTSSRY